MHRSLYRERNEYTLPALSSNLVETGRSFITCVLRILHIAL
jgi:hypothetical protein